MTYIDCLPDDGSDASASEFFDRLRNPDGSIANMHRPMAWHPPVFDGWMALMTAVRGEMDLRRYELVTLAAAKAIGSSYCMLAHGSILLDKFFDADQLAAIARDHRNAGLDELDVALMDYAEKVARDSASVSQSDIDRLKAQGLTDREIYLVACAAAMRCFFARMTDALGVLPDAKYASLPAMLKDGLVVGRPIAATA